MKKWISAILCLLLLAGCIAACAEEGWVCGSCGKDAVGNFCPWCGAARPPQEVVCPSCGATWDPDLGYAFCPTCGAALNGSAGETPTADEAAAPDAQAGAPAALEPVSLQPEECVSLFREAVFGTGQMIANAVSMGDALGDPAMAERFKAVDFGNPQAAALIEVPAEQVQRLCGALQCSKENLAKALNQKINSQFSAPYTQAAGQIAYSQEPSKRLKLETENCVAALLVYENDISLVLVAGDSEQGVFMLSAPSVLKGFGPGYVAQTLASLGLNDVRCNVYAGAEEMAALKDGDPESYISDRGEFLKALTASDDGLLTLLPQVYACGILAPDSIAAGTADRYLLDRSGGTLEQLLAACRFISGPFDNIAEWLDPDGRKWHEKHEIAGGSITWEAAPELALPEDFSTLPDENPIREGDKVLVLSENEHHPEYGTLIQSRLQCGIPEAFIPETPEEADYYLLVHTHYDEGGVNNGITLYNAVSDMLLYDARTNAPVYYIDRQTDKLEGFTMVSGDKYYNSVRLYRLLAKINAKKVFG